MSQVDRSKLNRVFLFKSSLLLGFAGITVFYGIFFIILKLISLKFTVKYVIGILLLFLVTLVSLYILLRIKPHEELKLYSKIRGIYKYERIELREFCKFLPFIFSFSLIGYLLNNYPNIQEWIIYAIFFVGVVFTALLKPNYEKIIEAKRKKSEIPFSTRMKDNIISVLGILLGAFISSIILLVLLILE